MPPTLQELRDQRAAAWSQVQEYNERSTNTEVEMTAEDEAAWERGLADIDSLGEQIENRERTAALESRFAEIDDNTTPVGGDGEPDSRDQYRAAFEQFCRFGPAELNAEQRDLLQANFSAETRAQGSDTGAGGGYTVPEGFWQKVTETMAHFGGMLAVAEILNTDAGNDIPWPTNDDTGNVGAILAENAQITEQDVAFGQKTLNSYTYTSKLIRVSLRLLQDSGVDIEAFLARKIGQRLGRAQNAHATTGTGSSQPQGFVTGATVGKTTASATAITHDEIIDLEHSVDVAYRNADAGFMFNDLVFAYVRKLKDTTGQPLWQPSVAAGAPSSLDGYGYTINNDMASTVASTNKTMAFGDFRSHYVLRQVSGGQMMRLAERYADYLQVGFFGFQRMDGLVQDTSAVKILQQAA